MSTLDVPGYNPANRDQLAAGAWAEHEDGSLILVKGVESDQVVYEIYDVGQEPPVYYQDAMIADVFKKQFSWKAGETSGGVPSLKWTWHDKTLFPWSRVMKTFDKPRPQMSAVATLTAAARVADSLKLRAQTLKESGIRDQLSVIEKKGRSILTRISRAFDAFKE